MAKQTNMDENAANFGDRLKHALLLEVLTRTVDWPAVHYAETHAGAGIYSADDQKKHHFIEDLRQSVSEVQPTLGSPGHTYHSSLVKWWSEPSHRDKYPGSAVTALRWFRDNRQGNDWQMRLCEADLGTCERLREALLEPRSEARASSFDANLDWLTEGENVVLLVDPFGIVSVFDSSGSGKGINDGRIDYSTLQAVLGKVAGKQRAVLSIWWSFGQAFKDHHQSNCDLLCKWAEEHGNARCRIFHDKRNHANALIGIGDGAAIVKAIPSQSEWKKSWMFEAVYEKSMGSRLERIVVDAPSPEKGSLKHMLNLVSSSTFEATVNGLLDGTGAVLSIPNHSFPSKVDSTEAQLEDYLVNHPHPSGFVLDPKWWFPYKTNRNRRPVWDLVCHILVNGRPGLLLVEAKAHIGELSQQNSKSPPSDTARSRANDYSIRLRLAEASLSYGDLLLGQFRLSHENHYQLSNRLAYLNKLAQEGIPTVLMYLGWLESPDWPTDPFRDTEHWKKVVEDHMTPVAPVAILERAFATPNGGSMQMIVRSLKP